MKKNRSIREYMIFLAFLTAFAVSGQELSLSGLITDNRETSAPVIAVLKINGVAIGTTTSDGRFSLPINSSDLGKEFVITFTSGYEFKILLQSGVSNIISENGYRVFYEAKPLSEALADNDADGVSDAEDRCPDVPGTRANSGCPEVAEAMVRIKSFPIPYPKASAVRNIPWNELRITGERTFRKVDQKLRSALDARNYERSYYIIPHGFALVTKIEKIHATGISKSDPERWSLDVTLPENFADYLRSVIDPPVGYFRVIAFLVTDVDLTNSNESIDRDQAVELVSNGYASLPSATEQMPFTNRHSVTAVIYEYKKVQGQPVKLISGHLSAITHLQKSGISAILKQP